MSVFSETVFSSLPHFPTSPHPTPHTLHPTPYTPLPQEKLFAANPRYRFRAVDWL
ncbi:MAG: hypothetical protein PX634_17320 [Microcystis sp. M53600_WE12]|nr:hypothetical protein [Microcystis sp. M53600_WE12]